MTPADPPRLATLAAALLLSGTWALPALAAAGAPPKPDADDGGLKLPPGFRALVVADDVGPARFLTVAESGDVYVKLRNGGMLALRDANGDGRADVKQAFGSGDGTGIAVRGGWLYYSTNSSVHRYRLAPGELVPKGEPETIVTGLPDRRQHSAKSFTFDDAGRLYVEVGSPSNAYGDPDRALGAKGGDPTEFLKTHGGIWRFDPEKKSQTQADGLHFSTGHRHIIALAWHPVAGALFAVMHGRDQLATVAPRHYNDDDNAELPAEEMHVLRLGMNLGWPFTYYDPIRKARMVAPEYGGDKEKRAEAGKYPDPVLAFPAHWAPMQMAIYRGDQFPAKYRNGAFIAFHGSWNRAPKPQKGYNLAFVPVDDRGLPKGEYEVFADGFAGVAEVARPADARHRPCGVAVGPDGSLYVADSVKGRVWRIVYVGGRQKSDAEATPADRVAGAPATAAADTARLYGRACGVCHMGDGSGVPHMQPPLAGSPVVAGDTARLVRLILDGAAAALPAARAEYPAQMPTFTHLSDQEIAGVLSYVRREFGNGAGPVTPAQVATLRQP